MFQLVRERELSPFNERHCRHVLSSNAACVQRMELQHKLEGHDGCVNTVSFDTEGGSTLISGSDDLHIILWDWGAGSTRLQFSSGHSNNVFQARMMPHNGGSKIVTCAADGQVCLSELPQGASSASVVKHLLGQHAGRAHKLALDPLCPAHCFYSCGEDGLVMHYDLRCGPGNQQAATGPGGTGGGGGSSNSSRIAGRRKLLMCRGYSQARGPTSKIVAINAIHVDPTRPWLFSIGGSDPWARVYDCRRTRDQQQAGSMIGPPTRGQARIAREGRLYTMSDEPVARLCPDSLSRGAQSSRLIGEPHVTCVMFSRQGELLASYNDEDIYLFSAAAAGGSRAQDGGGNSSSIAADSGRHRSGSSSSNATNPTQIAAAAAEQPAQQQSGGGDSHHHPPQQHHLGSGPPPRQAGSPSRRPRQSASLGAADNTGRVTAGAGARAGGSNGGAVDKSQDPEQQQQAVASAAAAPTAAAAAATGVRYVDDEDEEERPRWRRRQRLLATSSSPPSNAAAAAASALAPAGDATAGAAAGAVDTGTLAPAALPAGNDISSVEVNVEANGNGDMPVAQGVPELPLPTEGHIQTSPPSAATAPTTATESAQAASGTSRRLGIAPTPGQDHRQHQQNATHPVGVSSSSNSGGSGRIGAAGADATGRGELHLPEGLLDYEAVMGAHFYDAASTSRDGVVASYYGHRNAATVKGVGFFGEDDEYVISGSDCGHIFMWNKTRGNVVWWQEGDSEVVNCLEPHPALPLVLATSGIEHDIKLWAPTAPGPQPPPAAALKRAMAANKRDREASQEAFSEPEQWLLQLLAAQRRRALAAERARRRSAGNPQAPAATGPAAETAAGTQRQPVAGDATAAAAAAAGETADDEGIGLGGPDDLSQLLLPPGGVRIVWEHEDEGGEGATRGRRRQQRQQQWQAEDDGDFDDEEYGALSSGEEDLEGEEDSEDGDERPCHIS